MEKELTGLLSLVLVIFVAMAALQAQTPQLGKDDIQKVIQAMTPEEKVNLVMGTGMEGLDLPDFFAPPQTGQSGNRVPGAAGSTYAIPRLGIPAIVLADGPAGLRIKPVREGDSDHTYYCTAFPIATLLASSWDVALVEEVGRVMGNEALEYGVDVLLAPALNIHRNPLGGRNFEYYSEDPLISGKMAAAITRGVQSQGVGVSLKHFVANNHEWNRMVINVLADQRCLREIYLRGFEIAVMESRPWTIMSSYNKLNGTYTSQSGDLLTAILRGDWHYEGLVMTDWFAGDDAVAQMNAGNDLLMPGTRIQQQALMAAIGNDPTLRASVDRNIANILRLILRSPYFNNYRYSNQPDLTAHARIARQAAAEGMVLLKNDGGVLPLPAKARLGLFGNTAYEMITGGTGSGDVNEAYSISLPDGLKAAGFRIDAALGASYAAYIKTEKGKLAPPENPFLLPPAIAERPLSIAEINAVVGRTDLGLVTIGRNSGEFADRKAEGDFYLDPAEKQLIRDVQAAYHAAGKKVAVVLNIGGVIETVSWRDLPDAILLAWQPGQESGHAIAGVLSGQVNPSGKLATTFPIDLQDVPSSANFPGQTLLGPDPDKKVFFGGDRAAEVRYSDGIGVGYRHFNTAGLRVAYPFGFGLSYTQFTYRDLQLSTEIFEGELTVSVSITNTGAVAGREVVQLFLSAPGASMPKPAAELRAFAKTGVLEPGASQVLNFTLSRRDLASFDAQQSAWVVEGGEYQVGIGASSRDIRLSGTFTTPKAEIVEKVSAALGQK
ncbi:MAG TPA: glycoside hydrolase family 3 C-terminal domain-containing protein [Calditrichia bacterium]|nr:glycoside hydrolase family 3 C-terminal domain-containing protein [Calditrichia bacterium]